LIVGYTTYGVGNLFFWLHRRHIVVLTLELLRVELKLTFENRLKKLARIMLSFDTQGLALPLGAEKYYGPRVFYWIKSL